VGSVRQCYDEGRTKDVTVENEIAADSLSAAFEAERPHLRAVGYRMLGSLSEADDAVQEAWLRLRSADVDDVDNLPGWLTTVVSRICLDALRKRKRRGEEPFDAHVPDPIISSAEGIDPEQEVMLADAVGLALQVVLDRLDPAERLAFVLHDMFGVPFDDVAEIVSRSPEATRQLASRARRRVQGKTPAEPDLGRQRVVVEAFFAASRAGDFEALVAVLDPNILLRADYGPTAPELSKLIRGAHTVASQALTFSKFAPFAVPALVNGTPGFISAPGGKTFAVMAFTVANGKIVEINILADPDRLRGLGLSQ
jgi:RNA polymerase sigma factor (sigma-70 family)